MKTIRHACALLSLAVVPFAQSAPTISTQPTGGALISGWTTASLSVAATASSGTLSYQWKKDGVALANTTSGTAVSRTLSDGRVIDTIISGATGATLTITNWAPANAGSYTVTVTDSTGSIDSNSAAVTVTDTAPTLINQSPVTQTVSAGGRAKLFFNVNGSRPLAVQWFKDGVALAGANGSSTTAYDVDNFSAANAGNYTVTVSNAFGSVTLQPMALTLAATKDPIDIWRWANPRPVGNNLIGAASGGGRMMLVGRGGTVISTTDGQSGDVGTSGNGFSLSTSVYDTSASAYIAAGGFSTILRSTDAKTWTAKGPTGVDDGYNGSATDGAGHIVLAGTDFNFRPTRGLVRLSSDGGNTWTLPSQTPAAWAGLSSIQLTSATYGNGRFVVASSAGALFSSADNGSTWTQASITGATSTLQSVSFGGGKFVAVGNGGTILTSADGVSFSAATSGVTTNFFGVNYLPSSSTWVAVGASGTVRKSTDGGTTWSAPAGALPTPNTDFYSVAENANLTVITGQYGRIFLRPVSATFDLNNWENAGENIQTDVSGFINFADWDSASNQFIAVGSSGNIHTSTADGDSWQRRAQNSTGGFLTQWTRYNSLLLASGSGGIVLSSSDNASTWTANATTATSTQFNSIAVGGGRAVVVGGGGAIFTSTNGTAWTAATSGVTEPLRRVAYANGQFIAVGGADNGSSIRILTSSDGLMWTNRTAGTTGQLWGLEYVSGTWVAVGAASINGGGGFALRSTDNGVTWTRVEVAGTSFLYSVRLLGDRLIATGSPSLTSLPNALAVSADVGASWALKPVPAAPNINTLRAVAKSPSGAYVAVGNDATILTSAMLSPVIVAQPASATLALNGFVQLSVTVSSPFQLSYQWRLNGTPISGATNAQIFINNFDSAKAGTYDVVVTASRTDDGTVVETATTTSAGAILTLGTGTSVTLPDYGFQHAKFWRYSLPGRLTAAPNGKVYATFNNGGSVNAVDGQLVGAVVRLNADGTLDTSFNIGTTLSDAWAVVPLADGRVLVSGVASIENDETGLPLYRIFRFNADGSRDWSYNAPHFNGIVRFMTLQGDGKLLVTPSFGSSVNNGGFANLVRLNADGSFDSTFSLPSFSSVNPIFAPILVDANGKITIAGSFTTVNGVARPSVARLNSDGTLDTTFAPSGFTVSGQVRGLALQTQGANAGKLLVAGGTITANSASRPVIRLNTDGTLDSSFTLGSLSDVLGANGVRARLVNVLPDDRFTVISDKLVRYAANGTLDSNFPAVQLSTEVFWMDTLTDGSVYVPPEFGTAFSGQTLTGPTRFTASGALDATFTTGRFQTAVYPRDFSVQADGKILVWGNFDTVNSSSRPGFARLNADGTLDSLTLSGVPSLYTLGNASVLSDGRLLAITQVGTYRTNTTSGIARFNTDGTLDNSFALAAGVDPANLYVLPDNKILAWNLTVTNALNSGLSFQRLTADGAVDSSFVGVGTNVFSRVYRDASNVITEIVLGQFRIAGHYADGRALALGTTPNGTYAQGSGSLPVTVLRLNTDGSIDSTFNAPSVNWSTSSGFTSSILDPVRGVSGQWSLRQVLGTPFTGVVPQADGGAIIYGSFTSLGGVAAPGIARLTNTGAVDTSFSVGSGPEVRNYPSRSPWIQAIAIDAGGKIWVSGTFDTFGGRAAPGLTRLNSDGSVDTAFVAGARYTPFLSNGGKIVFGSTGNVYLSSTYATNSSTPDAITRLVAQAPLAITNQPGNVTVTAGSQITLSVGLAGAGNFTYQWRRNGVAIAGATQGYYQIPSASRADADRYDVLISDGTTTITSSTAIVSVAPTSYPTNVGPDTTFNPNPLTISARVNHAVQLADGKWLVAGDFTSWESTPRTYLAKLNADYSLDTTFVGPAFNAPVNAIAVAADGSIYVGGDFSRVGAQNYANLARLTSAGALDLSWTPQDGITGVSVTALATAPGSKLIVARSGTAGGTLLRRLNSNGTLDSTLSVTFSTFSRINSIAVEPDGAVAFAGSFSIVSNSITRYGLARVLANGSLDNNFGGTTGVSSGNATATPSSAAVSSLTRLADGRYLATGAFSSVGGIDRVRAVILNADGAVSTSFVPAVANNTVLGGALQSDGKIILTGMFATVGGSASNGVVRLNADGTVASLITTGGTGFTVGTTANTHFVFAQADGTVAVLGNFQGLFGQRRVGLAVIGADNQLTATAPMPYRPSYSNSVDVRRDGKIAMFGSVEAASGVNTLRQAALFNPDGTVDSSFPVGTGFQSNGLSTFGVYRAVRMSDGGYIATGDFLGYNGTSRARLLRIKPDGTADTAYNTGGTGPNATIVQILPLSGGRVLLGGFTSISYNGTAVTGQLLRINADGSRDNNFTVQISNNSSAVSAAVGGSYEQPDGKIVLIGGFTHFGATSTSGTASNGLLRLNADGTLDATFATGTGVAPGTAMMVTGLTDGRLVLVGSFTTFNGSTVNRMVVLNANGARDTTFTAPAALNGTVSQVIPQEDGKFLVFGDFTGNALRLNANGTVDTSFSMQGLTGGFGSAARVALGDDGSLYVFGNPHAVNYAAPVALSRFRNGTSIAPTIVDQPTSLSANLGDSFYFYVTPGGTGPHTYQWMRNGVAISGATSSVLRITGATATDIANYTVVVTNAAGSVTSSVATVNSAPVVVSQPTTRKVVLGGKLLLRFGVSGNNLTYQWTKDGSPVGGNSADYVIESAQNSDAGSYLCTATNTLGNVQSAATAVAVLPVDNVLWQQFTDYGTEQAPARLFRDGQGRFYLPWSVQDRNPDMAAGRLVGTLARFNENTGALDTTFKLDRRYRRAAWMERQTDGKLLIAVQVGNASTIIRTSDTGVVDSTFNAPFFGRALRFIKLQSDGKVIAVAADNTVAGTSATLGIDAPTIYRLNTDGSIDSGFTPAVLSTTPTLALVFGPPEIDSLGRIYLVGSYSSVNSTARTSIARLNADGTLDASFASTLPTGFVSSQARAVVIQSDGRAVVLGEFRYTGRGSSSDGIMAIRFNTDGTFDSTFAQPLRSELGIAAGRPRYAALHDDDSMVVVSDCLVRLSANGVRDPNFTSVSFDREGFWIARTADGRYLVPDLTWLNINGIQQPVWGNGVAAFASNGQPDLSFQIGGYGRSQIPNAGRVLSTGEMWVSGSFNRYGSTYIPGLAKFSTPTALAAAQAGLPANTTAAWTSLPGSIVADAAGDQTYTVRNGLLQRLNIDGTVDGAYSPALPTNYAISSATPTAAGSGKLILAQSSISASAALAGSTGDAMLRLNADGSRDTGYVPNLSSFAAVERATPTTAPTMIRTGGLSIMQVLADGRALVALSAIDGTFKVQRLNADGALDTTFNPPSFGTVTPIQGFTTVLLDPVTNTSSQWSVTTYSADDLIRAAVQMPDGKVYVGGRFSLPNTPRGLARLNADGSLDTTFTGVGIATPFADSSAYVSSLAVDAAGRVYAAGRFSSYNGTAVAGIFRLAADGSLDTSWSPGFGVYDLPVASAQLTIANGRLYAIGTVGADATSLPVPYASVAISIPPTITTQPTSVTAADGSSTSFSVTATGAGTLTYQWFLNGNAIAGATASSYSLPTVRSTDVGTYTVAVTSSSGTILSAGATLTVNASAPAFLARGNISGTFGYVIAAGTGATLTVTPSAGSLPITYQWRLNGVDIPGATGATYSVANWQPANAGSYSVSATNAQGTVVSPAEKMWVTTEAGLAWGNPRPLGNGTTGVIFANNRFVIGGVRGSLLTSTDGQTWTAGNLTGTNNIASFAFGNGTYVGVGTLGALYYSADGTNWEPAFNRPTATQGALNEVVFALGKFIAVGAEGLIASSTDGRNWSFTNLAGFSGINLGGLMGDEEGFYALTSTNKIISSPNGANWTEFGTLPAALNSVAASSAESGGAVAVGPQGLIYSTTDGAVWTLRSSGTTQELITVRFVNNQYIAVGTLGALVTSPDGVTWTLRTTPTQSNLWSVDYGAGRYVVTGQSGNNGRNILTSTDGVTWTTSITGPYQGTHLLGVATNNTTTVAVGNGGAITSSSDLATWTQRSSGTTGNLSDITYAGGKFVAISSSNGAVTTSTDGATWTVQTTTGLTNTVLQGITYDTATSNYVIVGNGGGIWTSPDATTWTVRTSPTTANLRKVTAANGKLVAVSQSGEVIVTTNATTTWTRPLAGTGRAFADVAFGNNTWVAVGTGTVYTSSDAATWNDATFASVNFVAVKFIQGNFIALANNHTYFTSTDGTNWQGRSSGAFDPMLDAVAVSTANGTRFVGVGNYGTILTGGVPSMPGSRTVNVIAGQRVDLNAHVSGSPVPVTYSWTKDGSAINGQTSYLHTINAAAPSDGATYVVTATNSFGFSPASITLVVNTPPAITTQPVTSNLPENGAVTLSVSASGSGTLAYQWFKDGVAISGATLNSFTATAAGSYTVQITSAFGTVTSSAAVVTMVPSAPVIGTAPSVMGTFGPVVTTSTAAALQANVIQGTRPMNFQWSFNGVDIPGATGEFLYRSSWQTNQAGIYSVRASNTLGASNVAAGESIHVTTEGGWRWRNPTPTGNGITRAAFVNNLFLLGGLRGTILTSSDGLAWTPRPIPAQNNVFAFRYVGNRYVAMASLNAIYTSPDAITWTQRNLGIDGTVSALQDMTAGSDGRLVAVGTAGVTAVSTDAGETWTVGNLGANNTDSLTGATFTLGRYFAVSIAQGRVYSSPDGVSWNFTTINVPWLRGLAYGAGRLVAVGAAGAIFTSTDGANWTPATSGTANDLYGVSFLNGRFIAVGTIGTILTSPDGLTWTARSAGGNQSNLQNTAYGAGRYVIGGQAGNSGKIILTSTNSENWTSAIPGPRQAIQFNAVAASTSSIVTVGNSAIILTSGDKATWTERSSGVSSTAALLDVVYHSTEGRFVAVGSGGSITTSSDQGVTWTLQAASAVIAGVNLNGIAASPNIGGSPGYITVGNGGMIATTTDFGSSTTWTRRTSNTSGQLRKVIYAGGQHIAVGGSGLILTSPDTATWTTRATGVTMQLNDVAYGASAYVVVGNGGTVFRSTDGITWTTITRFTPASLVSVKFIDNQFIATSTGGGAAYYVSTDGITWSGRVTGAFDALLDTVPFQNEVVGVGQFGTILTAGAPVISGAPATITAPAGGPVQIQFPTWNSAEPVIYVWTKDGNVLPSAPNAPSLSFTAVAAGDAGVYRLTASNSKGMTQSSDIQLVLNIPLGITTPPQSQTVLATGDAQFGVVATGTPAPSYAWYLNGIKVGTNSPSLTLTNLRVTNSGQVWVVVSNASGSITSERATLTVNPLAPSITSPSAAFAVSGAPFSFQIVSTAPATFGATGLPSGLAINATTGVIEGSTTQVGTFNVAVTAANITATANQTLQLTVQPPAPVITSALSVTGRVGQPFSYTIVASNSPTDYGAFALPAGITRNGAVLSGTPSAAGFYSAQILASNATGFASAPLSIQIAPPLNAPTFTGSGNVPGTAGAAFSFTPAFGGSPTSFALVNLPDGTPSVLPTGLSLNTATGAITGTTTQTGTFKIAIRATNADGSLTQVFTLTLNPAPTAPAIKSATSAIATVGTAFTFNISTDPAATGFSSTALPDGLALNATTGVITGVPTTPGITNVTLTATNAAGSGSGPLQITVNSSAAAPVVSSAAVAPGRVGVEFYYTIAASNSPTSFSVTQGTLPAGLSLNSETGLITGLPTVAGQTKVWVAAANSVGGRGPAVEILIDIARALTVPVITSNGTASGQVGATFQYQIVATNSPTSYTATALPDGLTFNSGTGVITGIPTTETATPFEVTLTAVNADGTSAPKTLAISVVPAPATPKITSALSAGGRVGTAFSYQITATETPTSFTTDQLPAGLTLNSSTGVITGTPTASGTTSVQLRAANAAGLGQASTLVIEIAAPLTAPAITSDPTASAKVGAFFSYQIVATNTPTGYVVSGSLPGGLTLNSSTGLISGNPADSPGLFAVYLTASNSAGTSQPQQLLINVAPADNTPVITSASTASGMVGVAFSYQITATNVPATTPFPPSVSLDALGLPAGLAINASTGLIEGTPTNVGTSTIALYGVNSNGTGPSRLLTIVVSPAPNAPSITSGTSANAQAGTPFSYQITATNNPTSFEALDAPAWLSVNTTSGLLSGTPTGPGTATLRLGARNAGGASNYVTLTLTIAAAPGTPVITSEQQPPAGRLGQAFSYDLTATFSPTSFEVSGLPPGLTVNAAGQIRGTPTASGTYSVTVSGRNANGQGQPVVVTIVIQASLTLSGGSSG